MRRAERSSELGRAVPALLVAVLMTLGVGCGKGDAGGTSALAADPPAAPAVEVPAPAAPVVEVPSPAPVVEVTAPDAPAEASAPAPAPVTPDCGGLVTVRLRGADATGSGDRAVEVGAVTAEVEGAALQVRNVRTGLLDVTSDQAYALGNVVMPEGTAQVDVRIPVLGGRVGDETADGCTGPIVFRLDPALVDAARCHVVVQLDPWSFSAVATAAKPLPVIVPAFTVRY